jgi:putative phage-type endonuclease
MPRKSKFDRGQGLGGTDIAAIVGENPYKSILDVYADKVGLTEREIPGNYPHEAAYWGTVLEATIADHYAAEEGVILQQLAAPIQHPKVKYFYGSPDRLIKGERKGLEVKTASLRLAHHWGERETDDIPPYYRTQCEWYMGLTNYRKWDVALLIGGQEYRPYRLEADPTLFGILFESAQRFWIDHVLKKVPPEPTGTEKDDSALRKVFAAKSGKIVEAPAKLLGTIENLREVRRAIETQAKAKVDFENLIKFAIGENDGIEGPFGKITWKKNKDGFDVDWEQIVDDLTQLSIDAMSRGKELPFSVATVIDKHTKPRVGARSFRVNFKE